MLPSRLTSATRRTGLSQLRCRSKTAEVQKSNFLTLPSPPPKKNFASLDFHLRARIFANLQDVSKKTFEFLFPNSRLRPNLSRLRSLSNFEATTRNECFYFSVPIHVSREIWASILTGYTRHLGCPNVCI